MMLEQIILLLKTKDKVDNQCIKMLRFLYKTKSITFEEVEKYAYLLAEDEKYDNYIVKCPLNDNKEISYIDCLKTSNGVDKELKQLSIRKTKECLKCPNHNNLLYKYVEYKEDLD